MGSRDASRDAWLRAAHDQFRIYQRAMRRARRRVMSDGVPMALMDEAAALANDLYPSPLAPAVLHPSFYRRFIAGRY
jgi:hypothetical protein